MQFKDECDSKVEEVLKIDEELVEIDVIDWKRLFSFWGFVR